MATTTNYSWTTPDDTALVKDGAAAIRTLGTSVDTTTKNLNPETTLGDISYRSSTANVNTRLPLGTAGQVLKVNSGATAPEWATDATGMTNPMTTTGDTIYSSSGSTPARLGIGTAGQVLKVNSGATAPEWGAAPAAGANFSLLNAGGTSLTGASTITVSSISGIDKFMIRIAGASAGTNSAMTIRFNSDSGSNYKQSGWRIVYGSTYYPDNLQTVNGDYTSVQGGALGNANGTVNGYVEVAGGNTAGVKTFASLGSGQDVTSYSFASNISGGVWDNSATISSISIISSSGNFDAGTLFIYGSA